MKRNEKLDFSTRTYRIWKGVIRRGLGIGGERGYYDRGIKVCLRWLNYANFLRDMGEAPPYKSLDRINVNKGYSPTNCRWANIRTQANNKTTTVYITHRGKRVPVSVFCDKHGLHRSIVLNALEKGLTLAQIRELDHRFKYEKDFQLAGIENVSVASLIDYVLYKHQNVSFGYIVLSSAMWKRFAIERKNTSLYRGYSVSVYSSSRQAEIGLAKTHESRHSFVASTWFKPKHFDVNDLKTFLHEQESR